MRAISSHTRAACRVAAALLVAAAAAGADDVEPEVVTQLGALSTHLASLDGFSFDAVATTTHRLDKGSRDETIRYHLVLRRPNRFRMTMSLPGETLDITGDGDRLLLALGSAKQYAYRKQPEDLGTLVGWLSNEPSFRRLMSKDLTAGWMDKLQRAHCTDDERDGVPCKRIDLTFDRTDVRIWFQAGDSPLPIALHADLSRGANHPAGTLTTRISWTNWKVNDAVEPEVFSTEPPEGMEEVDSFAHTDALHPSGSLGAEALIGAKAPPFSMALANGGRMDLSEHRGKNALLLEFWATWCRPCRKSLKAFAQVARQYADTGTIFLAVNVMEDTALVRKYLESNELGVPVALDPDGSVSNQFMIGAVPTLIAIGREGTIQGVHVGFDRWAGRRMQEELDAILRGEEPVDGPAKSSPADRLRYRLGLEPEEFCAVFVGY